MSEPAVSSTSTNSSSVYSYSTDENYLNTFPQRNMNIAIWGIEKTDGTQSISQADVRDMMEYLNAEFNQFNICFNLIHFDYIISDQYYERNDASASSLFGTTPLNQYTTTAIRVIIPYKMKWRGVAYSNIRAMLSANQENINGIFVHEIGHIFNLKHTHDYPCENVTRDPNDPNYNAETAGDYVVDTQASPTFYGSNMQYVSQDCNSYTGNLINPCDGLPYNITVNEIANYMAYTRQHCRTLFTTGQKIRMHESITVRANNDFLDMLDDTYYDLYSSNSALDHGIEPDNQTEVIWDSPDIWVRNQPDGLSVQEHEDLEFVDNSTPVYVYVKVKNKSCNPSTVNDTLNLYWAKGGIGQQTWPDVWTGLNNEDNELDVGNFIGSQAIPVLNQGQEAILEFTWQPKNPDVYEDAGFSNKPWMFCFLGRIVSANDNMTYIEDTDTANNTRNNNNIAYKNTTTVNVSQSSEIGSISAGNYNNLRSVRANINFFTDLGNPIWQEAEIRVVLNQNLWSVWQNSGGLSTNVKVIDPAKREILITGNNSSLNRINFAPNEWGILTPRVNFLIKKVTGNKYTLHINQTESSTGDLLGGFTYHINRNISRRFFKANANLETGENITLLEANDINESATYNWYDEDGEFISSGQTLSVTNTQSKDYILEVITASDGHKDYETFTAKENRLITSISPNPTISDFTIYYRIGSSHNAFINITNINTGASDNYLLDHTLNYKTINLINKPSGQYIINLVTDNIIVDTKQLIKN